MKPADKILSGFGCLLCLLIATAPAMAQDSSARKGNPNNDCSGNCFSAEIVSVRAVGADCKEYEMRISHDGTCRYELSHLVIEVLCGKIKSASNTYGCREVIGKDPTTGITGLKFDNVNNFGKGYKKSFTVRFTLCGDNSCRPGCWEPRVAFKAATCVDIVTAGGHCTTSPLTGIVTTKSVSCFGGNDGTIAVTVEGGTGPYTYLWSNSCGSDVIENVPAGTYTVIVKDAAGNQITLSGKVESPPPIVLSAATANPTCAGDANGRIALTVSGGKAPYTYIWSNGATGAVVEGLAQGTYGVTVTDASGCTARGEWALSNPVILITAQVVQPSCGRPTGSINILVSGGTAPYSFQWSNGSTSEDISDLLAGTYRVIVTDAHLCTTMATYTLRDNNTLKITSTVKPTTCLDDHSGAVDVTVTGGTAPYTYLWAHGATSEDLTGLGSGIYRLTVTDASGCTATAVASVFKKTFQVESQVSSPGCAGLSNGSITLNPIDGTAPYVYQWSNGQTGNSISNLSAGLYSVTIIDATGCSQQLNYFISDPNILATALVSNVSCGAEGSYAIDLTVTGGKVPYTYAWSTGETTEDIAGLNTGTYHVEITDASGCHQSVDVTVNPSTSSWNCLITAPSVSPGCGTAGNQLTTSVAGAQYAWSIASADNSWVITSGANSSQVVYTAGVQGTPGTFTLTITKDGCVQTCSYTIQSCKPFMTCGGTTPPPPPPADVPPPDPGDPDSVAVQGEDFHLAVYPNPMEDRVHFEWTAEEDDHVVVQIVDLYGRQITELYADYVKKGEKYKVECSGGSLKDPMYIYCFTSGKRKMYGKLMKRVD